MNTGIQPTTISEGQATVASLFSSASLPRNNSLADGTSFKSAYGLQLSSETPASLDRSLKASYPLEKNENKSSLTRKAGAGPAPPNTNVVLMSAVLIPDTPFLSASPLTISSLNIARQASDSDLNSSAANLNQNVGSLVTASSGNGMADSGRSANASTPAPASATARLISSQAAIASPPVLIPSVQDAVENGFEGPSVPSVVPQATPVPIEALSTGGSSSSSNLSPISGSEDLGGNVSVALSTSASRSTTPSPSTVELSSAGADPGAKPDSSDPVLSAPVSSDPNLPTSHLLDSCLSDPYSLVPIGSELIAQDSTTVGSIAPAINPIAVASATIDAEVNCVEPGDTNSPAETDPLANTQATAVPASVTIQSKGTSISGNQANVSATRNVTQLAQSLSALTYLRSSGRESLNDSAIASLANPNVVKTGSSGIHAKTGSEWSSTPSTPNPNISSTTIDSSTKENVGGIPSEQGSVSNEPTAIKNEPSVPSRAQTNPAQSVSNTEPNSVMPNAVSAPLSPASTPAVTTTIPVTASSQSAAATPAQNPRSGSSPSPADPASFPRTANDLPPSVSSNPVQVAQIVNRATQSEMRIGMNTQAFGSVEIHTVVHANEVGVQIGSEKGDLRSLLSNELPGIANNLQQQNLRLNQVNFHQGFAGNPSSGNEGGPRYSAPAPAAAKATREWDPSEPESTTTPAYESEAGAGINILV